MKLSEHQKAQMYAGSQFGADIVNFIDRQLEDQFVPSACKAVGILQDAMLDTDEIFIHFDAFLEKLPKQLAAEFNDLLQAHVDDLERTNESIAEAIRALDQK
jgi:hypothetical protein